MEFKMHSITEVSKILELHPKTVLRFIHEGKIKATKIGRSWKISEGDLKEYCNIDDTNDNSPNQIQDISGEKSISVSAVVEITNQDSEEASRISNSFNAMLISEQGSGVRFDFFYYPDLAKAKYVFYGKPSIIARLLQSFETLAESR